MALFCICMGINSDRKAKMLKAKREAVGNTQDGEDEFGDNAMPQITCEYCGKEFDFDYPKCPFCHSAVIADADLEFKHFL
jgi:predicted Zn-ribbon and HTH transcriptional regulator